MKYQKKLPPLVQMYDRSEEVVYYKRYGGLIFSSEEIARIETLKTELIMEIHSERMPDKILFNGKEVVLRPLILERNK